LIKSTFLFLIAILVFSNISVAAPVTVSGKINKIMVGNDNWYGVRFYLDITSDGTNGQCNPAFIYTEPEANNGNQQKVAVFLAAYMAGKQVDFTVDVGRGGLCKLIEGSMY